MEPSLAPLQIKSDEELARELNSELNANTRRSQSNRPLFNPSDMVETRASKRQRISPSAEGITRTATHTSSRIKLRIGPLRREKIIKLKYSWTDGGSAASVKLPLRHLASTRSVITSARRGRAKPKTAPRKSIQNPLQHGYNILLSTHMTQTPNGGWDTIVQEGLSVFKPSRRRATVVSRKVNQVTLRHAFNIFFPATTSQEVDGRWSTFAHQCSSLLNQTSAAKDNGRKRKAETGTRSSSRQKRQATRPSQPIRTAPTCSFDVLSSIEIGQNNDGTWSAQSDARPVARQTTPHAHRQAAAYLPSPPPTVARGRGNPDQDQEFQMQDVPSTPSPLSTPRSLFASSSIPRANTQRKRNTKSVNRVNGVPYYTNATADKPEPFGVPPAWAEKRQQLCEALPFYRAYMSGAYMDNGVVKGFMCDKEVGPRDKFTDEVMIARVGGGRSPDSETGQMVQSSDQIKSAFALGFERAKGLKTPVAVIVGQGNRICPTKLPHYYNVMDWFHVTDIWCEISEGFRVWLVRLEKVDLWNKSWWAPRDTPFDSSPNLYIHRTQRRHCDKCNVISKLIYNAGWTCLNTACSDFFDFGLEVDHSMLDYNEAFMLERSGFFTLSPLPALSPAPMDALNHLRRGGEGVEASCARGLVCPTCQGCTRRIDWAGWTCEHGCGFTFTVPKLEISVNQAVLMGMSREKEFFSADSGIRFSQKVLGMYDMYEYYIPGLEPNGDSAGFIRHFKASRTINCQPDGPDDLFRAMQLADFGLKRKPARQSGSIGEVLTSHWATNWGAPYKYGVAMESRGFDEAPAVILKAVKRLTWAGNQAVTDEVEQFRPFNELLSIGYMEASSIGYHDDGEKELGPTIATLSLGCQATMTLRPKAKVNLGKRSNNAKGTKPPVLRMELDHGDIVIMHGSGIQQNYEHAVKPHGKLRFALTCRHIIPEKMPNDAERLAAAAKGTLPPGHEQYEYDGDMYPIRRADDEQSVAEVTRQLIRDMRAAIKAGEIPSDDMSKMRELLEREQRTPGICHDAI